MDVYFLLWLVIQYYFHFIAEIVPALVWQALSVAAVFLWHHPLHPPSVCGIIWSPSLVSSIERCSRIILYISCPSSRISHFSKEPGSFHGDGVRKQIWVLGLLVTPGVPVLIWLWFCFIGPAFLWDSPFLSGHSCYLFSQDWSLWPFPLNSGRASQVRLPYYWFFFSLAWTLLAPTSNADVNSTIWYLVFFLVLCTSFSYPTINQRFTFLLSFPDVTFLCCWIFYPVSSVGFICPDLAF